MRHFIITHSELKTLLMVFRQLFPIQPGMLHLSAFAENGTLKLAKLSSINKLNRLIILSIFLLSAPFLKAQDTFLGLTSNGGPEGRGTAFSTKNNGTNFSITHAFAEWGKTPNGDLIQGDDGDFYGMTLTGQHLYLWKHFQSNICRCYNNTASIKLCSRWR